MEIYITDLGFYFSLLYLLAINIRFAIAIKRLFIRTVRGIW